MAQALTVPWWQTAVVYQVYPRSFADGNGDGVGDLIGLRRRLDHLAELGVDAVWLSPFYRSPMADFGYDVADHTDVDPLFGTLDDFDALLADAHARGIRVLVDLVPNHTSDQHPWFRDPAKRDWYIRRDGAPDTPPNNWRAAFGDYPAWTWDEASGQWYLHLFLPQQPDLDWANPEVEAAMHDVMRFWLDRGVDGFRIDVVHGIGKDPALPDDPPEVGGLPHATVNDDPRTHPFIRRMRALADSYDGDRVLVGEVYLLDTRKVVAYYGDGDELHLAFNFPPLYTAWDAGKWRRQIERAEAEHNAVGGWPTWVLSNHDNVRHCTRYGSEACARAAAVLLLTLRGTPFVYQGDELGLEDAEVPADRVVDPGGRDGCRAPIPWDGSADHGWPDGEPWLPFPAGADTRNVATLRTDEGSILHLYRRLLAVRRGSPALRTGTWRALDAPDGVLAYERRSQDGADRRVVIVNFGDAAATVPLDGRWRIDVEAADPTATGAYEGSISGSNALLLSTGE
ncbi:MAG: DUF3459 domain-containing protein [Actinobacteria bacterium]|nr:DUF3459 domain-containing protein [Actinomycetota bacterium]